MVNKVLAAPRTWLREGIVFGLAIGAILVISALISSAVGDVVVNAVLSLMDITVVAIGYIYAGQRAAQRTGKMSSGTLAGLIAGSIAYTLNLLALFALTVANIDRIRLHALQQATSPAARTSISNESIIAATAGTFVILLLLYGVAGGAALGSIGGRLGRKRYYASISSPPRSHKKGRVKRSKT